MQDLRCLFGTENFGHFLPTASILLSPLQLKPKASGDGGAGFGLSQSCKVPTDPRPQAQCSHLSITGETGISEAEVLQNGLANTEVRNWI